jgi:cytochrome c-type biogenesis protein CcmH
MPEPPVTGREAEARGRALAWGGRLLLLAALALLVFMLCAPRAAVGQDVVAGPSPQEAELEANVRRLSAELRCPVCQGLSLADSPSELSQEMRDVVRAQLVAGKSPDEVKDYFVARYGEWILLQPKAQGWNLMVYALPAVLVLAGLGGVLYVARRWTLAGAAAQATAQDTSRAAVNSE